MKSAACTQAKPASYPRPKSREDNIPPRADDSVDDGEGKGGGGLEDFSTTEEKMEDDVRSPEESEKFEEISSTPGGKPESGGNDVGGTIGTGRSSPCDQSINARTSRGLLICWEDGDLLIEIKGCNRGTKTRMSASFCKKECMTQEVEEGGRTFFKCADGRQWEVCLRDEQLKIFYGAMSKIEIPVVGGQSCVLENEACLHMLESVEREVHRNNWEKSMLSGNVVVTRERDVDTPFVSKRCRDVIFETTEMMMHGSSRPKKRRKAGSAGAGVMRLEEPLTSFVTSEVHVHEFSLGEEEMVDRGGVSGDNNLDMVKNFPTQVLSRKWTMGEIKWFATHWMYDVSGSPDNEPALVACGGGNAAACTFSRKWSPQEMEWFDIHWNYDKGKVTGGDRVPLMSPDGSIAEMARDKVETGQYVPSRPPKKPGGGGQSIKHTFVARQLPRKAGRAWITLMFLLLLAVSVEGAKCKTPGESLRWMVNNEPLFWPCQFIIVAYALSSSVRNLIEGHIYVFATLMMAANVISDNRHGLMRDVGRMNLKLWLTTIDLGIVATKSVMFVLHVLSRRWRQCAAGVWRVTTEAASHFMHGTGVITLFQNAAVSVNAGTTEQQTAEGSEHVIRQMLNNGSWGPNLMFLSVLSCEPNEKCLMESVADAGPAVTTEGAVGRFFCGKRSCESGEMDTVTTVTDTLDESSLHLSDKEGDALTDGWSIVINGTRFVGHARFGSGSDLMQEDSSKTIPDKLGETKKERNRRLLLEHRRTLQASPMHSKTARSGRRRPSLRGLKIVKEEDEKLDRTHQTTDCVPRLSVSEADQEAFVDRDVLRRILRRRANKFQKVRRTGVMNSGGIKCCSLSVRVKGCSWITTTTPVAMIIRLYTCSAFRHAMFRSCRRFKPGD